MKYAIVSDIHFHNWSAFSHDLESGMNSRLNFLISEVHKIAARLKAEGGNVIFIAGDVFHVRGSVAPSVLNPVQELFEYLTANGFQVHILAGNHDLEGKHSNRLGSAITALEKVGCVCYSDGAPKIALTGVNVGMVPWIENVDELKERIQQMRPKCSDLIIHAPMNNVIKGLPDNGLDPQWLLDQGFRNVFSGHYHNHKDFFGSVFSIGAIAHHTWGDVGSVAGSLLVDSETGEVQHIPSTCPSFIELTPDMSVEQMKERCFGNYVKARLNTSDQKALQAVREALEDAGALGVVLVPEPKPKTTERQSSAVSKSMTLAESVSAFIDKATFNNKQGLNALCQSLLQQAGSAA